MLLTGDGAGVPVRAAGRLGETKGLKVLVLGLGPVGLATSVVQLYRGANVAAVEPHQYRRELAGRLGVATTWSNAAGAANSAWVDGAPPDIVAISVGRPEAVDDAFRLVASGGRVVQLGECETATIQPARDLIHREITYLGSWYFTRADYPTVLSWREQGLDLGPLVTHTFDADQVGEAYQAFVAGATGKVVLTW